MVMLGILGYLIVLDGIDYIGWRLIVLDVLDHMGLY